MAMGYREKPFDYYDPEQEEYEGHRAGPPPLYRAPPPVSPRLPISPRAAPPPPGLYPEPDLRFSSRAGVPGTPQERPFEYYNPKATVVPPGVRGLDAEPGYGMDSRGIGRAVPPPPSYVNRDPDHLPMCGAPPNVSYGRGAPVEPGYAAGRGIGCYGDGHYDEPDFYDEDGRPGYKPRSPRRRMPGRNEDPAYDDVNGKRRESGRDRYEDPAYYDAHGTKPRYADGESRSPRPAGRYDDPPHYGTKPGHGDEDEDFRRPGHLPPMPVEPGRGHGDDDEDYRRPSRLPPMPVEPGRGAPERGRDGRGYGDPDYGRRPGDPGYERRPGDPGYERRPGDKDPDYERRLGDRDSAYERRPGDREPGYERRPGEPGYERRSGEPGYERRPVDKEPGYERRPVVSGVDREPGHERRAGDREPGYERRPVDREPGYERRPVDREPGYERRPVVSGVDREPGYERRGRDAGLGDGRYAYGGLRPLERLDSAEVETPPAPISSEYAHQVYATVFTDPVYGGAGYVHTRAGYHEEPVSERQAHRREDLLRHPDRF